MSNYCCYSGRDCQILPCVEQEIWDRAYEQGKADAIEEFAEWLPKHFDLRFSNNPSMWLDEYFNHTSEKVLEQFKKQEVIDKPTDKQLAYIADITAELGFEFKGNTKEEAREFISKYACDYRHSRDEVLGWGEMHGY